MLGGWVGGTGDGVNVVFAVDETEYEGKDTEGGVLIQRGVTADSTNVIHTGWSGTEPEEDARQRHRRVVHHQNHT